MGAIKKEQDKCHRQSLAKHFSQSTFSIGCHHGIKTSWDLQVDGVLINNECFTHPLVVVGLDENHPHANANDLVDVAWEQSTESAESIQQKANAVTQRHMSQLATKFDKRRKQLPQAF